MTRNEWIATLEYLGRTSQDLIGSLLALTKEAINQAAFARRHPFLGYNPFGPEIIAEIENARRRKEIKYAARYLRERRYIVRQREGQEMVYKLTKSGEIKALRSKITFAPQTLPSGEYTVVTFDIPEDTKPARQQFRRLLRGLGFVQYQKSVWICSKDIKEDVHKLLQEIKVGRWATVFRGVDFPS